LPKTSFLITIDLPLVRADVLNTVGQPGLGSNYERRRASSVATASRKLVTM
jgi:hypothetical protein